MYLLDFPHNDCSLHGLGGDDLEQVIQTGRQMGFFFQVWDRDSGKKVAWAKQLPPMAWTTQDAHGEDIEVIRAS